MRKLAILVLSLVLCLSALPLTVFASEDSFVLKLHMGEQSLDMPAASSHVLPQPTAPEGKVFAGWYAEATEDKAMVFLPAGATVTKDIATELTALFVGMTTRVNAELRLTAGDEGVRFITDMNRDDLDVLSDYTTILSMGTLIVPEIYLLLTKGVLTHAAIERNPVRYNKYLDVVTTGAYAETRRTYSIAGSVSKIPSKKLYTDFAGVGYLKITYTNGSEGYVYSLFSTEGETKLYPLAVNAFGDRADQQSETYAYRTSAGYSPYSTSELTFMKSVLDRVINLDFVKEEGKWVPVINPNIEAYDAPFTVTGTKNSEFTYFFLMVKDGTDYRFNKDFFILLENGKLRYIYDGSSSDLCRIPPESQGKVMTVDFNT